MRPCPCEEEKRAAEEARRAEQSLGHGRYNGSNDTEAWRAMMQREQDRNKEPDAGSLWKQAVKGGGGNEIYNAIAAMRTLAEVSLPTGASDTLVGRCRLTPPRDTTLGFSA